MALKTISSNRSPNGRDDGPRPPSEITKLEHSIEIVLGRLISAWKTILMVGSIALALYLFASLVPNARQYLVFGVTIAAQFLIAALYMIFQFVILFWFLGRPRMYWVMPGETGVGFEDYRGNPEVLEVAKRIVMLLRGVKEFRKMGGEVTRGLLLVGPPGTGKSYLGQCISTEAGVPFGYLAAPSIQGMFWGMDVMRVWSLYRKARKLATKYGACILFLDEIDAIGRARSGQMGMGMMGGMMGGGGGALNQLLTEMDPLPVDTSLKAKIMRRLGLQVPKAVIPPVLTMGATNLPQTLDQALLRPGRFDRMITIDLPTHAGRKEIIEYYLNKVIHDEINLDRFAYDTIGYSPVAIKHVINEAVIQAHFGGRRRIGYEDITRAREVHEWGLRQPIKDLTLDQQRLLAYHEMGHAVAQYRLLPQHGYRFHKVTIIRHGQALGLSAPKPEVEKYVADKKMMLAGIQTSLASRAAEELFLGMQSSGVFSDFGGATQEAGVMVAFLGMDGTFASAAGFGGQGLPGDPGTLRRIDRILKEQYREVRKLLEENWDECVAVAETLLLKQELNADEVEEIIKEVERRRSLGLPLMRIPPLDSPPVTWEDVDSGRHAWNPNRQRVGLLSAPAGSSPAAYQPPLSNGPAAR